MCSRSDRGFRTDRGPLRYDRAPAAARSTTGSPCRRSGRCRARRSPAALRQEAGPPGERKTPRAGSSSRNAGRQDIERGAGLTEDGANPPLGSSASLSTISCASRSTCIAVGYRFSPYSPYSTEALADLYRTGWLGARHRRALPLPRRRATLSRRRRACWVRSRRQTRAVLHRDQGERRAVPIQAALGCRIGGEPALMPYSCLPRKRKNAGGAKVATRLRGRGAARPLSFAAGSGRVCRGEGHGRGGEPGSQPRRTPRRNGLGTLGRWQREPGRPSPVRWSAESAGASSSYNR